MLVGRQRDWVALATVGCSGTGHALYVSAPSLSRGSTTIDRAAK
jgi:hypothetical protein